jgi:predicted PurR-regulated permease PerM
LATGVEPTKLRVTRTNGDRVPSRAPLAKHGTALTILAAAASIALVRYMAEVLIPLVLAGLFFYALDPLVDRLERWGIHRALGATLVLIMLVGAGGALAYRLADDVAGVVAELPAAAQKLRATVRGVTGRANGTLETLQRAAKEVERAAEDAAGKDPPPRGVVQVEVREPVLGANEYIWLGSRRAMTLAGQAVMLLFLTYFLLITDDLFKRKLVEIIGVTFERKRVTVEVLNEIARSIERFLLVQVVTSLIVAVATWLALAWVGVERPGMWGLAAGVFNSIPYFGPLVVTAGLATVALVQFGTLTMALGVGALALVITTLEGWLLTPWLLGRAAQMNTVAVFASLLFWSWMWGVAGLLLAVPIMMTTKAVCDRIEGLEPFGKLLGE